MREPSGAWRVERNLPCTRPAVGSVGRLRRAWAVVGRSAAERAREGAVFGKILVGTDGSETAKLAVAHAAYLAAAFGSELVVATAHGGRSGRRGRRLGSVPRPDDAQAAIARALLRDAEHTHGSNVRLRAVAVPGPAGEALVGLAGRESVDLVVVGNRGMGRAAWAPLSSVPDRVSHRAPVCVLIVDTMGRRPPGFRKILAGTDGSPTSPRAVGGAVSLGGRSDAEGG